MYFLTCPPTLIPFPQIMKEQKRHKHTRTVGNRGSYSRKEKPNFESWRGDGWVVNLSKLEKPKKAICVCWVWEEVKISCRLIWATKTQRGSGIQVWTILLKLVKGLPKEQLGLRAPPLYQQKTGALLSGEVNQKGSGLEESGSAEAGGKALYWKKRQLNSEGAHYHHQPAFHSWAPRMVTARLISPRQEIRGFFFGEIV